MLILFAFAHQCPALTHVSVGLKAWKTYSMYLVTQKIACQSEKRILFTLPVVKSYDSMNTYVQKVMHMCLYNMRQSLALSKFLRFLDSFQANDTRLCFLHQAEINVVHAI